MLPRPGQTLAQAAANDPSWTSGFQRADLFPRGLTCNGNASVGRSMDLPRARGHCKNRPMRLMPASILVNPASDATFKRLAETHAARGPESPEDLEDRLRQSYPRARVVEGISSDATSERWYVYRDGRWINPDSRNRRRARSATA
jgi:hypothetical protein